MSTPLLLELFGGFLAACMALWFVALSRPADQPAAAQSPANQLLITTGQAQRIRSALAAYVLKPGG
ncbi:DoxX family protein, partial [Cyanobium sp. A1C-AMD]|nr:DoxX family protein [Cyanobium sp. A1C-AMD]